MKEFYSLMALLFLYAMPAQIQWLMNKLGLQCTEADIEDIKESLKWKQ